MITGVQDVYYNTKNLKQAIRFYTEALQLKVLFETEYWTALDCHGVTIGLHPVKEKEFAKVERDSHGSFGQAILTLKSNHVPEDRERIERAGGKVLSESDQEWGHMLVFEDLDGNVLKLMNPKY